MLDAAHLELQVVLECSGRAADADDVVAAISERLEKMIRSMIFSACFISPSELFVVLW